MQTNHFCIINSTERHYRLSEHLFGKFPLYLYLIKTYNVIMQMELCLVWCFENLPWPVMIFEKWNFQLGMQQLLTYFRESRIYWRSNRLPTIICNQKLEWLPDYEVCIDEFPYFFTTISITYGYNENYCSDILTPSYHT